MFYFNFIIPSLGSSVKVKELTFKQYKTLNKFLLNNNNFHIAEYFDVIVSECLLDKEQFDKFNNFDKFCLLFLLRTTFVSKDIEYKEGNANVKISLLSFLKDCLDFKTEFYSKFELDKLKINIALPKALYFENLLDAYYSSIDKVFVEDEEIDIFSTNQEEKLKIIEQLPAEVTNYISIFSKEKEKEFSRLIMTVGTKETDKVVISPYNTSMFEILKALYFTNLKNIYEMEYILYSKLFVGDTTINENTLTENLLLCKLYEEELAKINEEQAKSVEKLRPSTK